MNIQKLTNKCVKVVSRCKTKEQLRIALKYVQSYTDILDHHSISMAEYNKHFNLVYMAVIESKIRLKILK